LNANVRELALRSAKSFLYVGRRAAERRNPDMLRKLGDVENQSLDFTVC